jgi:hypothetical protein
LNLIATGNLTATGINASIYGTNISALVGGDLRLNDGASMSAAYEVDLDFAGANSTLYLNDVPTYTHASYISADIPQTISLLFLRRNSGGIVIDGAPMTGSTTPSGSGFFTNGNPAVLGAGLDLAYAAVSTTVDICTINPASCAQPTTPTQPPPVVPPVVGPGGTQTPPGSGTTGGGDDQFGGSSSSSGGSSNGKDSDKDKKDDKQSSDSSGDKKDDKSSGKKPVGKCSA